MSAPLAMELCRPTLVVLLLVACILRAAAAASPLLRISAENVEFVAAQPSAQPDSAFYSRYPYVIIIDEGEDDNVSDADFYKYAASVVFKVSRWDLPQTDKTFRELKETVLPRISSDSLKIVRIRMRGAASPEGPQDFNKFLSEHRQQALYDFIKDYVDVPQGDSLVLETETEDYNYLYKRMMQDGDPDCERVKQLFDEYMPRGRYSELKRRLQQLDGGRVWRRMLVTYFPSLRAARMVIVCQRPASPLPVQSVEPQPITEPEVEQPVVVKPAVPIVPTDTARQKTEVWMERYARRELLSVKTNLLGYVGYMPNYGRYCPIPNVAIEYYPLRGHFTYGASFDFPWWQNYWQHKYFQIRNYQLESRYYFRRGDIELRPEGQGAAYKGLYLQAYGNIAVFGICFDERRGWEGEVFGAGLGVGYVLPLGKREHWRMEFQLQVGFLYGGYDPYQWENPVNPAYQDHLYYYDWTQKPSFFKKRQYRFTWVGPTRIGVTLSYDLLYRKARNKTNGIHTSDDTEPTKRYNPLVPYEKHQKGDRQ